MDERIIIKMVDPYLKENTITYHEFESIFDMLSLKEQYAVLDILDKYQIEVVDDSAETEVTDDIITTDELFDGSDDIEILYDDRIFSNRAYEEIGEEQPIDLEFLKVRKRVRLSNLTLIRMIQEGDAQAKQDLCIKNQGLVKKVAKAYYKAFFNKLEFEDLEQAGMLGMIKAAEKFDFNKDTEFSTYAMWWIKQAILREIQVNGYTIRIPVHKIEQIKKVYRLDIKYREERDYYKRIKQISIESDMGVEDVEDCLKLLYQFFTPKSLETPVGEEEDTPLGELIPITKEPSVEDIVMHNMLHQQLEQVLKTLDDREQEIIRLRFGMDDGRERTLEEVGQCFGVTRERIRQIENKVLRKLRHPSRSKYYRDFLNL